MSRTSYFWNPGARRDNIDPQVVGETLEALANEAALTPEAIVQAAQVPASPLHPLFDWDDTVAARRWRISQARSVMHHLRASIVTVHGEVQDDVRAFVSVQVGEVHSYVATVHAVSQEWMMRSVLTQALAELNAFRRRYAEIRELASVWEALDAIAPRLEPPGPGQAGLGPPEDHPGPS